MALCPVLVAAPPGSSCRTCRTGARRCACPRWAPRGVPVPSRTPVFPCRTRTSPAWATLSRSLRAPGGGGIRTSRGPRWSRTPTRRVARPRRPSPPAAGVAASRPQPRPRPRRTAVGARTRRTTLAGRGRRAGRRSGAGWGW